MIFKFILFSLSSDNDPHNLLSVMIFSGASKAFFRLAMALVSFRLGPRGSFKAAISVSVNNIKASKSICSESSTEYMDDKLLAIKNLCKGVHSSSVSSLSVNIGITFYYLHSLLFTTRKSVSNVKVVFRPTFSIETLGPYK